ncbi:MAG: hypothetical protein WDA03_06430 [Trueperaceae bacterium]
MNLPTISPVTARLSGYAAGARQIISELYDLAGRLSHDLDTLPAKQRAAAQLRGLPTPARLEHDPSDVRAALQYAHELQALLPAAVNLADAITGHLERLDALHRLQIDGLPPGDEPPPGPWSAPA